VLLTAWALIRGNSEGAAVLSVIAALIKPQFGVVALPLIGAVLLRRHVFRVGEMPRNRILLPEQLRGWFDYERGPWRLVSSAVAALFALIVILLPFGLDPIGFLQQMQQTAGGYPYLSVNAYNPWAMLGSAGNQPLAFGGGWSPDTVPLFGPIPGVIVGGALLLAGLLAAAAVAAAVVAWRNSHSGSGGSSGGKLTPPAQIHLAGVGGYDPYGDHQEHDGDAAKATDSSGATAWTTEHYRDAPSLGKQGVGLVLDAGKTVRIGKLGIATDTPGYTAQIEVGDSPDSGFHAVSSPQPVEENTYFTLSNAEGRYYLIWITKLGDGYDHADVNAVSAG
jgi:hypothetical protein